LSEGVASPELRLDRARLDRTGIPEVVYGESKSAEQIAAGMRDLHAANGMALATRVSADAAAKVCEALPDARYDARSRILHWGSLPAFGGRTAVVCAGTSDLPVADEAAITLQAFGHTVDRYSDVGVAGVHRTLAIVDELDRAHSIIVVAGMEGALPSVVAGLVKRPIVAVPTSVGYGAAQNGFTALFAMLSSCAPGIAVVNIDNGFGAAAFAHKVALAQV
jgi:NCAIR mutase (PurE)-related protein